MARHKSMKIKKGDHVIVVAGRGTPPNVVETDPLTWLKLATGRLSWAEATGSGAVQASGPRADLSAYLPVIPAASLGTSGHTSP